MLGEQAVRQIFTLRSLGWGMRRISRETGFDRNPVRAWIRKGADRQFAGTGRPGVLAPFREWIRSQFEAGVRNADVVRQRFAAMGITVSLRTVERALRPLRKDWERASKATLRFETPPGKQMQVDFGEKWLEIGGVQQKRYVFVATLGYSRRCYVEAFGSLRQRDWIMGLERAFQHFGGVPEEVLTDNAKPLVNAHPQGGKAVFHPEFEGFCRHWGVIPRACQPYRARTKGKVENGVGYVKKNALGGLAFASDETLDEHLAWWMLDVADARIHGTTHERPIDRFEAESPALRPVLNHPSYLRARLHPEGQHGLSHRRGQQPLQRPGPVRGRDFGYRDRGRHAPGAVPGSDRRRAPGPSGPPPSHRGPMPRHQFRGRAKGAGQALRD